MQKYEKLWKVGRLTARHVPGGVPGVVSSFTLKFSQQAVQVCGCDTEQRTAELWAEFFAASEQTFSKTFNPFLFLTCHLKQRGKASFVSIIPGACLDYKFFEEEKTPGTIRPLSQIGAIITAAVGSVIHVPSRYLPDWELPGCDLSGLTSKQLCRQVFLSCRSFWETKICPFDFGLFVCFLSV